MKHSYKNMFETLYTKTPSVDLADRIDAHITLVAAERSRRKAYSFGALALVALIALVPAIQYAFGQTTQSGLYEYMSLFVSDSGYVFTHLREVMMTVVESLPMTGIMLTLATLLVTAYATGKSATYLRFARQHIVTLPI